MAERSDTRLGGMRFWLLVQKGEEDSKVVEVPADGFLIGRDADCHLVLDDDKVSRRHARIRLRPGRTPEVEDLDSANGTFVNGSRVRPGPGFGSAEAVSAVGDGDWIQCGDTMLRASFIHPSKRGLSS